MEIGGGSKGGEGFIDRSKVRILLCDNDTKSSQEVFTLLCKCSYQVTSVRSARQVIDALNAEGPDIDIILAEVDLPMAKGTKMLKYITRDKVLHRIPVIMMSALDEVSVVVKCLRLGAADYLVKPLRTNELLNLWTHMWRRRRMLGLAEKNILTYDFDLVVSDPSDANTNSTTLFSDDTDERSRKATNLEASLSMYQEYESTVAASAIVATAATVAVAVKPPASVPMKYQPSVAGINVHTGPKKSELRVGESSAFFSYVKSSIVKNTAIGITRAVEDATQHLMTTENLHAWGGQVNNATQIHDDGESHSQGDKFPNSSAPDCSSLERYCMPPMLQQFPKENNSSEDQSSQVLMHTGSNPPLDISGFPPPNAYPYYISGMGNQVTMPSSQQMYQKNPNDLQNPATLTMYNHLSQCHPSGPGMASFPYYPVSICLQPGQMPSSHSWPSFGSPSPTEAKSHEVDRRLAALIKFRKKRKERCFDKKIRYVNRKKLAERRPRVRGQFVRKGNGVDVDLNDAVDFDEDDEEYAEQASRDYSPEEI